MYSLQTTEGLKVGDVLSYWYDAGGGKTFGMSLHFARIVKVCPKRIWVVFERGTKPVLKRPWMFSGVVSPKEVAELRAEGVKI